MDTNTAAKSSFLEELNKEFADKGYNEKDRNRELGLYVKQDYANTKNEEIEKLKAQIKISKNEINNIYEKIRELEQKQVNYCESISALRRITKEEGEKKKDLSTKLSEFKNSRKE